MKTKFAVLVGMMLTVSIFGLLVAPNGMIMNAKGQNNDPILMDEWIYTWEDDVWFDVTYMDSDGDSGDVYLYLNNVQIQMWPYEGTPTDGQYFEIDEALADVTEESEFYFYAEDSHGSYTYLYDDGGVPFVLGDYLGGPVLTNADAYLYGDDVIFEVTYQNEDGELGYVFINFFWDWYEMTTPDLDPISGQRYSYSYPKDDLTHDTSFWFDAFDDLDRYTYLDNGGVDFLISDFISETEWGFEPVLSNPDVTINGDYVVFEVTYQHDNGEFGSVWINFDSVYYDMETTDSDPYTGQRYSYSYLKADLTHDTAFWFDAYDDQIVYGYLDNGGVDFLISDFITTGEWTSGTTDNGGDGGVPFGEGWLDNPEVLIAIIALVAMGGGSAYGLWRKKKKRGHFSEMLTKLDDIYRSFKMNPHKCEIELEKMRALANEDLKRGGIDETNFQIVKDRIDDMITEIRGETLTAQVKDMPKDIEIRIKDMLIDGKISRKEYDKLLPLITGSDMSAADKEKTQELVEFWVDKDKKKADRL
jgi:hypothetical protein